MVSASNLLARKVLLTKEERWKLRNPERGYSMGSPLFTSPSPTGLPIDYIAIHTVPHSGLKEALEKDLGHPLPSSDPLLAPDRCHLESFLVYSGHNASNPAIPLDGSHIISRVAGFLPTSRGTITLRSNDPEDPPIIDPNYYATEVDKYVLRTGVKCIAKMLVENEEGRRFVECETTSEGCESVGSMSTDSDIDRIVETNGK
jgi:hypothetical protein